MTEYKNLEEAVQGLVSKDLVSDWWGLVDYEEMSDFVPIEVIEEGRSYYRIKIEVIKYYCGGFGCDEEEHIPAIITVVYNPEDKSGLDIVDLEWVK